MIISGGSGAWSAREKTEAVAKTVAILQPDFVEKTEGDSMHYFYATEIATLLKQSRILLPCSLPLIGNRQLTFRKSPCNRLYCSQ